LRRRSTKADKCGILKQEIDSSWYWIANTIRDKLWPSMESIAIQGLVDDQHRLSAVVPGSVPPGPVTVWIVANAQEDDAGAAWMTGISHQWADELGDPRQDIYTLADGDAVDPT
jgi:hypothetical protein